MKVRVFRDFDASVSSLTDEMPEGADPREHAVTTLRTSIINGIYHGSVTGREFHYVVLPEPLILEPEDYPGEQWELLCKVFGTPGASVIRVENYDILAFYEEIPETCRERLKKEHPDEIDPDAYGGCFRCPHNYGYADKPDYCWSSPDNSLSIKDKTCRKCWDRLVEEVTSDEEI